MNGFNDKELQRIWDSLGLPADISMQEQFEEMALAWRDAERTGKIEELESPYGGKYLGCSECKESVHVYDWNLYGKYCHNCGVRLVS